MSKIGRVIDTLDAPALRRILDAPLEAWNFLCYTGCPRCFVGHALDLREEDVDSRYVKAVLNFLHYGYLLPPDLRDLRAAEVRIIHHGTGPQRKPRLIRAMKIRALKALERHVLESAVPQLQETA